MKKGSALIMIIRFSGLIQLILGGVIWAIEADYLIMPHMTIGTIFTIALFIITYKAYRAGISKGLVILAAVWALILPIWGASQELILPEPYIWISKVLHLMCGVGAIGLAEMMTLQMSKITPSPVKGAAGK